MAVITYKCRNCDGGLIFDPDTQQFRCEYCGSLFTEQELTDSTPDSQQDRPAPEADTPHGEAGTAVLYTCPSCGGEIVTDETTAATFCYYCQNPVVLSGRLDGAFTPDSVVPFVINKEEAVTRFLEWTGKKWFIPRAFFSKSQIEKISGIYFPCWIVDCDVEGALDANATRVRSWESGDTRYTETKHFRIRRVGRLHFEDITKNALQKANRKLMDRVQPFDHREAKAFSMQYLLGFQAEKRDMERESLAQEVQDDISRYTQTLLSDTISGYSTVVPMGLRAETQAEQWQYTLLPVWVLTYKAPGGKLYYYAMNGQNGKVCGELPVDMGRLAILFAALCLPLFPLFMWLGGMLF
ncbi:MAG: TFIIB-type zinc ribbon-containing protein [Angelakisella sp.]